MKKRILAFVLIAVAAICVLAGCGNSQAESSEEKTKADDGKVNVKLVLVLEDKTEIPYDVRVTEGTTLREALYEAGLISEDTLSAMFVDNIDGHIADAINDGVTWMPADENGEQISGTFDEITVSADQTIQLIYTVVPNFED